MHQGQEAVNSNAASAKVQHTKLRILREHICNDFRTLHAATVDEAVHQ
jgi:hypothetical protein